MDLSNRSLFRGYLVFWTRYPLIFGKLKKEDLIDEGNNDVEKIEKLDFVFNSKVVLLNENQPTLLRRYFGKKLS